jgi:hypothetical protein
VLANTASLNQLLQLSRAFKHSTHILTTTPAPVRISCGVSFWQTLQKRSVRGKAAGCDEHPGHESIVWPPMVDIMLLGWCPRAVRAVLRRYWYRHRQTADITRYRSGGVRSPCVSVVTVQEFPQNFGALVANPFAFSVLLFAKSGIARYGSIGPETSLTY